MRAVTDLEQLPVGRPIFIYGAGGAGRALRRALSELGGRDVAGYVDSVHAGMVDDLPLRSLAEYAAERPEGAVLVVASQWWDAIAETAAAAGVPVDLNAAPLIPWLIARADGGTRFPRVTGLLAGNGGIDRAALAGRFRRQAGAIDVLLNPNCSHRCAYCCAGTQSRDQRYNVIDDLGPERYLERLLWLADGARVVYRFAGAGECAEHPDFAFLLRSVLRAGHAAAIQTHGFTSKRIAAAMEPFGPPPHADLSLVVSFHYGAYLDQGRTNRIRHFLDDHFPRLLELTTEPTLVLPITPSIVADDATKAGYVAHLEELRDMAAARGARIRFAALELQGSYLGRPYPESFTAAERLRLADLLARFGCGESRREAAGNGEDGADVMPRIGHVMHLKGMPCFAAGKVLQVRDDGVVVRCGSGRPAGPEHMGRLTDDDAPRIEDGRVARCPFDTCNCVTMGLEHSLEPLGLTARDYLGELERVDVAIAP